MADVLATLTPHQVARVGILAAFAVELATIVLRFGGGWRSPEVTRCCARLTAGWRVHHGYVGVALLVVAWLAPLPASVAALAWIAGIALALSDAIHHFAVLWPVTGSHEFYVRYPACAESSAERELIAVED
jgi:hypothetical protein